MFSDDIRVLRSDEYSPAHSVQGYLQTRRDIDLIRPGEHTVIGEPMMVKPFNATFSTKDFKVGRHAHMLSALLGKGQPIVSICPMRLFVFSQELPKIEMNLTILWVKSENIDELSQNLERITRCLWELALEGRKFIIKFPWERAESNEMAVLMQPDYVSSKSANARLMDANLRLDQISVAHMRMPYRRPFGNLHEF